AEGVRAEAAQSVARELVLEAAADKLRVEVSDDEVEELIREQAEPAGEDPDEVIAQLREAGRFETLRADLRLKETLDRIVSEVKRISPDLAQALAIYDTMQFIKPDVQTICVGTAMSMGALLLAGGTKGKRMALPNSKILIHQVWGGFQGQATDIEIHARETIALKRTLEEIM